MLEQLLRPCGDAERQHRQRGSIADPPAGEAGPGRAGRGRSGAAGAMPAAVVEYKGWKEGYSCGYCGAARGKVSAGERGRGLPGGTGRSGPR